MKITMHENSAYDVSQFHIRVLTAPCKVQKFIDAVTALSPTSSDPVNIGEFEITLDDAYTADDGSFEFAYGYVVGMLSWHMKYDDEGLVILDLHVDKTPEGDDLLDGTAEVKLPELFWIAPSNFIRSLTYN